MIAFNCSPLFLLGLILSSCTMGYMPAAYYDQDMLVDFPLLPHTEEVQVYFPHDTLPNEEYIRVGVLEARGGEFTSYNELIRRLQFQAQERGVDAIQLMDKQIEATEYYGASILSAIGIKYFKNLDYIHDLVRSKEIYINRDGSYADSGQWVTKVWFDFNGVAQKVEGDWDYAEFIRKYSLDYLLYSTSERWRYALDEKGQVRMRVRSNASGPQLRAWFSYQSKDQPNFVRIREYPSREESTIWLAYDAEGKVLKKRITLPNGDIVDQIPVYDTFGREIKSEYYRVLSSPVTESEILPDQQLEMYLLATHQFYSPDDVRERIVLK